MKTNKSLSPEEQLLAHILDGSNEDKAGAKVVGIGKISGTDLASLFKSLGVPVGIPEACEESSPCKQENKPQEDETCDSEARMDSSITLRFDATGGSHKYSLKVHVEGSMEIAEYMMAEALCAMVERKTPGVDVEMLLENLIVNIALARSMAKLGKPDKPNGQDETDSDAAGDANRYLN